MKYIIDPYLFAFDEKMSKDELDQYILTISELDIWWKSHRSETFVMSEMGDLLHEHGIYPLVDKLAPLLKLHNSEFEYKDISRMINHYLDQTTFIDEVCSEECIEKTSATFNTAIQADISSRPKAFQEAFSDLMWFVYCLHLIDDKETDAYAVFSKAIDKPITITYDYERIDTSIDPDNPIAASDKTTINCHSSMDAFRHDSNTPVLMWRYSGCKSDLDYGLRCQVLQDDELDNMADIDSKYHFMLQDSFYEDFCNNHYARKPSDIKSAIDSITKAIKNIRHGKEHNMRTGPGPNDPYLYHIEYGEHMKIVSKFSGMRKNVTTSIKLMYWKKTPYYQFARIEEHDFYDLPWEDHVWT